MFTCQFIQPVVACITQWYAPCSGLLPALCPELFPVVGGIVPEYQLKAPAEIALLLVAALPGYFFYAGMAFLQHLFRHLHPVMHDQLACRLPGQFHGLAVQLHTAQLYLLRQLLHTKGGVVAVLFYQVAELVEK